MKLIQMKALITAGDFELTHDFASIQDDIDTGLRAMEWPPGTKSFSLNPTLKGNGVKPIKSAFMKHLGERGWFLEHRMELGSRLKPGPVDAVRPVGSKKFFAVEWETGNISSSHRAVNKMALGLIDGLLAGGILIFPSRHMYKYLTDRVGNFEELEPYFPIWEKLNIDEGYLAILEIEPDAYSEDVPLFPKGTDGWNLYQNRNG